MPNWRVQLSHLAKSRPKQSAQIAHGDAVLFLFGYRGDPREFKPKGKDSSSGRSCRLMAQVGPQGTNREIALRVIEAKISDQSAVAEELGPSPKNDAL
ncbi:MAG: hypothetical protein E5W04_01620 [Mesorhizobium sp.]|nr:MAG: hypothetical protein E5W04_01620 [Mesorhizobium sp.]